MGGPLCIQQEEMDMAKLCNPLSSMVQIQQPNHWTTQNKNKMAFLYSVSGMDPVTGGYKCGATEGKIMFGSEEDMSSVSYYRLI